MDIESHHSVRECKGSASAGLRSEHARKFLRLASGRELTGCMSVHPALNHSAHHRSRVRRLPETFVRACAFDASTAHFKAFIAQHAACALRQPAKPAERPACYLSAYD